jgi:IS30 family transposase
MNYEQLTQDQRYHISALLNVGKFQNDIAHKIGVHKSTISREIKRNSGGRGYRPKQAQEKALFRRENSEKHVKLTDELRSIITGKIKEDWSPDQISGYLKKEKTSDISHERIYQFILEDKQSGGTLYTHLRHSGKKRKKRYGTKDRRGQIKNRVSIDERPKIVEKKRRIGDWEGDTIIGKQQQKAIVTLVDRASKFTLIGRVATKHADVVSKIIVNLLSPLQDISHTLTLDNGKEFSAHEKFSEKLSVKTYFAHPYSSWERGLNENTNGLIRQYIKKGSSFDDISRKNITAIQNRLNDRPRKILAYSTPREVFEQAIIRSG